METVLILSNSQQLQLSSSTCTARDSQLPARWFMKIRHPCASEGLEGVRRGMVEASIGEDGQRAHSGENDENPQEHPVHHHCHILPIFFQLKEASERQEIKKRKNGYDRKKMNIRKGK